MDCELNPPVAGLIVAVTEELRSKVWGKPYSISRSLVHMAPRELYLACPCCSCAVNRTETASAANKVIAIMRSRLFDFTFFSLFLQVECLFSQMPADFASSSCGTQCTSAHLALN